MVEVALKVGGELHRGWKDIKIVRNLARPADAFNLTLTRLEGIKEGSACEVWHGDAKVLSGYVDEVLPEYDAKTSSLQVVGRSKAADLVDCSLPGQQFNNLDLLTIARSLADPFGIDITAVADIGGPFKTRVLEPGQPIYEFLDELARIRGVRFVPNVDGDLIITRSGATRIETPLVLGENIIKASGRFSSAQRFSEYTAVSQQSADDQTWGNAAANLRSTAQDKDITRYRPSTVQVDGPGNSDDCGRRIVTHRNRRHAEGQGVTYTVNNWQHSDGLWMPNNLVLVKDSIMGINDDRLITEVRLTLNEKGERTELRVMPKEAFDLAPLPEKSKVEAWQ